MPIEVMGIEPGSAVEQRKADVEAATAEGPPSPTDEDLAELAGQTASIVRVGDRRQVKAVLQALVQRIDVESRAHIRPVFFVPAVRAPDGSVLPASHNPNAVAPLATGPLGMPREGRGQFPPV